MYSIFWTIHICKKTLIMISVKCLQTYWLIAMILQTPRLYHILQFRNGYPIFCYLWTTVVWSKIEFARKNEKCKEESEQKRRYILVKGCHLYTTNLKFVQVKKCISKIETMNFTQIHSNWLIVRDNFKLSVVYNIT